MLLLNPKGRVRDEYERDKQEKEEKALNLFNERFKASMRSKRLMIIKNKTLNTRTRQKESTQQKRENYCGMKKKLSKRPTPLADRQLQ